MYNRLPSNHILLKTINLKEVLKEKPELFDLSLLDPTDIISLLKEDIKTFGAILKVPDNASPELKVEILSINKLMPMHKKVKFEEQELESLKNDIYNRLLRIDFVKYVRKDKFLKLPKSQQADWFIDNPEWYVQNVKEIPHLTSEKLYQLSKRSPKFIDENIQDFSNYTTTGDFWLEMIRYSPRYENIFLANTKTLINQTEVRRVIWKYPLLIKKLTANIMVDSKLTVKQWVILVDQLKKTDKYLKNWDFDDETKEVIKLDLMAEMLTGKTKASKRFTGVMNNILAEKEQQNEAILVVESKL